MRQLTLTRKEYLELRIEPLDENNKRQILRHYFNAVNNVGWELDLANFFAVEFQVTSEAEGIQQDIETIYPSIVKCFDKIFEVTLLYKLVGQMKVLKAVY